MSRHDDRIATPPASDQEVAGLADLINQSFAAFGGPPEFAREWLDFLGPASLRVVRRDGRIAAGLALLHWGQFFGGRSVSSCGISCVGVAPEYRGSGLGRQLMQSVLRELAARGTAISSLYPSTYVLYRACGYEPAGARIAFQVDTRMIQVNDHALRMRRLEPAEYGVLRETYAQHARRQSGAVDRSEREWEWIVRPWRSEKFVYVIEAVDAKRRAHPEGYVIFTQSGSGRGPYEIRVLDRVALTALAGRRLLTFFADHRSMAHIISFDGALVDPLLALTRDENMGVERHSFWMLRMVDVKGALAARGYPPGLTAEVHFEVEDDLLEQNSGRFVLAVENGGGTVRKGGRGKVSASVRGLAPLFTGHMSAFDLRSVGLLDGREEDLAVAGAVFAGPPPWMSDRF